MEHSNQKNGKKFRQTKYRHSQTEKGLVRFELQVSSDTKAKFDELVAVAADEIALPDYTRQRIAKARAQVFDEITGGINHEFFVLKDKLKALQDEITALSPDLTKTPVSENTPIPQAVSALPDDPKRLKQLLAYYYQQALNANRLAKSYKEDSDRYLDLYEVATNYNDQLMQKKSTP